MAVTTTQLQVTYSGIGAGPYAIPFPFLDPSHIRAAVSSDGVVDPVLLETSAYLIARVNGTSFQFGNLTTVAAVTAPATLTISRVVPLTQPTVFQPAGPFPAKAAETALDRVLMQLQQINALVTPPEGSGALEPTFGRWSPDVAYLVGDIVTGSDGNQYLCKSAHTDHDPTLDNLSYWKLAMVNFAVTLNVPARFATIANAWTFIGTARIGAAGVTIKVADGTYDMGASLDLSHPFGSRISLVGNETTAANVVLDFSGLTAFGVDGDYYEESWGAIGVHSGNVFKWLNGFKLLGPGLTQYGVAGILAFNGARIICGPQLRVQDFYAGLAAVNHSYIQCDFVHVSGGGDGNLFVYNGSAMSAQNCISEGANSWYAKAGAMVEHGSALFAPNSIFRNNVGTQVACHFGSTLMLTGSTFLAEDALAGVAHGVEFLFADNCDLSGCTYMGVSVPMRMMNLDTESNSQLFLFGSTTYPTTAFFQIIAPNAHLSTLSLSQENVATAYLGFAVSSTALVLANDGPSITLKVASSGALDGSTAASFTAAKTTVPKLNVSAIPTSASGLVAGDVWSNSGVLTIV